MSDKIDQLIDEALNAEERELMHQIGEEPGYFTQVWGVFGGRIGWVSWVLMIAQTIMFVCSVYAAFRFFGAADVMESLRWGIPSATLLIIATVMKLSLWPTLQTNRVLRELKRLELQIARGNS